MTVSKWVRTALLGAGLAALAAGVPYAATTPAPAGTTAVAAKAKAPTKKHKAAYPTRANFVEPAATAALTKMSAYLKSLPTFQVKFESERDEVDDFGQLLTFNGEGSYQVRKPDSLVLDLSDSKRSRHYVYDGKTVVQYDPVSGFYATFDAPPTIGATLDMAAQKYGIDVPLYDLFKWGDSVSTAGLTSGHYVGVGKVNGQAADHYSFRQSGVDWQIWIATGDKPLPLRLIIVASDDPARPQFESTITWDTAPQFAADTFVFTPPANAKSIPLTPAAQ